MGSAPWQSMRENAGMVISFSIRSDEAYASLGVKKPGQKWFAFDGSMDDAKKGNVTKLVTAIWNYHPDDTGSGFGQWAIVFDEATQSYWYQVVREKEGQDPNNRKALWNALSIARKSGIPILALLKDRKTHRCSLDHVFAISKILQQDDGSALWLQLEATSTSIGTHVRKELLPRLIDLDERAAVSSGRRSPKLTVDQYSAGCQWARKVYEGIALRAEALDALETSHQITQGTAAVLLNNYRCLVEGSTFKAPMSVDAIEHFADDIIARYGDSVGQKVLDALDGYVDYALTQWGSSALKPVAERLRADLYDSTQLQKLLNSGIYDPAYALSTSGISSSTSEVLKEVWVRGPQHAAFRRALQRRWSNRCAVHGVECNGQLRASHIVAWSLDKERRGDPDNGLLLSVPLDCLFDQGLVSFDDSGRLLKANALTPETARLFGLTAALRLAWDGLGEDVRQEIRYNLRRHRERFGFGNA